MKTLSRFHSRSFVSALFLSLALGACGQNNGDLPECGNGLTEVSEQCDDGNTQDGDGCSSLCEEEDECGDGVLNPGAGEQCDDGNLQSGDGCSSSCRNEGSQAEQIDEYILGLGEVSPVAESTVDNTQPITVADGDYECTSKNITETKSISEVSILQDGTVGFFPGDILRGDSLAGNGFTEAAFDRKPMTYSLSIQDGTGAKRDFTMQNPSTSEFHNSIGTILAQANLNNVPVSAQAKVQEVKSENELEIALGVTADTPQFDIKGEFNFNNTSLRSHYLVTVDMKFFDATVDAIVNPSDVFADTVTPAEVQQKFSDGNPPVYVSSIAYGTRFYFAIESAFDSQEVQLAIDASFKNVTTSVDGQFALSSKEVLNSSSLTFVAVGASTTQISALNNALSALNPFDGIKLFLQNPAVFSAANIGVPLSFQLKHLADNQPAAFGITGTFDVESCIRVSQNIRVTLDSMLAENINEELGQGQDALEVFGQIRASSLDSGSSTGLIFNASTTTAAILSEGTSKTFGGLQNQVILKIKPEEAKDLRFIFNLSDADGSGANDPIVSSQSINIPFTDGFNRSDDFSFSSSSGDLTASISLKPVL